MGARKIACQVPSEGPGKEKTIRAASRKNKRPSSIEKTDHRSRDINVAPRGSPLLPFKLENDLSPPMKKTTLTLALLCLTAAMQSGCVVGRRTVMLPVPAAANIDQASKGAVFLQKVTDDRIFEEKPRAPSTPSIDGGVKDVPAQVRNTIIGRQRGGYGNAMGDVALPEGESVQKRVTALLEEALKRRGYVLTAADPSVPLKASVSVKEFWAWMVPWGIGIAYDSRLTCQITLSTPQGSKTFEITCFNRNVGQVASNANWQLVYARSFDEFLRKLDKELEGALQ